MYTHVKRSHTHVKDPIVHVTFSGLRKHRNNTASIKCTRVFIMWKLDTIRKKAHFALQLKMPRSPFEKIRRNSRLYGNGQTTHGIINGSRIIKTMISLPLATPNGRKPWREKIETVLCRAE